ATPAGVVVTAGKEVEMAAGVLLKAAAKAAGSGTTPGMAAAVGAKATKEEPFSTLGWSEG
ncbi:unnamed protein product, partial [Polarella glacialis]